MWQLRIVLLCVTAGLLPLRVEAASLSGILIYAADQSGNPSGWDAAAPGVGHRLVWHTQADGTWNGLGILAGAPPPLDVLAYAPPQNLEGTLLNAPDFTIDMPLSVGENDFTLLGEPDPSGNPFDSFVLNLYFDGMLDDPGISVLFPRRGSGDGDIPEPNQSSQLFTLGVDEAARGRQATVYDGGSVRVSVETVSFGPARWPLLVDRVSASAPSPNGGRDWIGVLTLLVEASAAAPSVGGFRGFGLPAGPVGVSGTARVGPDVSGASPPVTGGESGNQAQEPRGDGVPATMGAALEAGTPSPEMPTPNGTATPAVTATLQDGVRRTPSALATVMVTTPTTQPSPTAATSTAATPTAAATATSADHGAGRAPSVLLAENRFHP